jgi:integrase
MTALSADQLIVLLAATRNDGLHVLWVLLATAGLRVGEALGLKWEDVDLDARRLAVKRALQQRRGVGLVFVEPKTPRSRRAVPLTSIAVEALRDHRDRQTRQLTAWEDSGLVFTNLRGQPMQPNTANSELRRALHGSSLPQIRFTIFDIQLPRSCWKPAPTPRWSRISSGTRLW